MKKYVPIIIGLVALCAVLYLGGSGSTDKEEKLAKEETSSEVTSKSFQGSVTKMHEGEQKLAYGLDLEETATATVTMDGALVKVTDADMPVLAMYISYEGARGYTPADYIAKNIMTKVTGVTVKDTVTVGGNEWAVAESANSVWHVASVENGKWLIVAENKKIDSEKAAKVLESFVAMTPEKEVVTTEDTSAPAKEEVSTDTIEVQVKDEVASPKESN